VLGGYSTRSEFGFPARDLARQDCGVRIATAACDRRGLEQVMGGMAEPEHERRLDEVVLSPGAP